jgi:hypothetical protein
MAAIESYRSTREDFHFATVADVAIDLVRSLQIIFKTEMISMTGATRRTTNTVSSIEIIAAIPQKLFTKSAVRKFLIIQPSRDGTTKAHTWMKFP